jgi:hypothetical protein
VLLDIEPWVGSDALDVNGVRCELIDADRERLAKVLTDDGAHKCRQLLAVQQHVTQDLT